jgi:hypothetical protein
MRKPVRCQRTTDPVSGPDVGVSSIGQGDELMAESQILDHEVTSTTHGRAERQQEGHQEAKHRTGRTLALVRIANGFGSVGV